MLKSYFQIALRNLRKNKVYTTINMAGLAVGLSVFWLMALYIADELNYDRSSVNADRIYRVAHSAEWSGGQFRLAVTPSSLGPTLQKDFPGIEAVARVDAEGGGTLIYGDKKIGEQNILFADNSLLSIYRYPFLYGNSLTALASPHSIVLTRSLAIKLFGRPEDALNKSVLFQHDELNQVTGVIEDQPANSHLQFQALRSMPPITSESWQNSYLYTYVLLRKGMDAGKIEAASSSFYERHMKAVMQSSVTGELSYHLQLQPVTSIHLHSNLDYEIGRNSDIRYVWLFSAIALLVLLIAIINYVNLATARSSVRIKEIGVRRVVGSGRGQLISLFLTESFTYTMLAAMIAGVVTGMVIPLFNTLTGKTLSLWQFGVAPTLLVLIVFSLFVGLTGGIYPALFLSGFRAIPALKGQQGNVHATVLFRKSLVTFQFVITIVLVAGSSILYWQLHYMLNRDLGFNKDQVLTFHVPNTSTREHIEDFRAQLLQDPSIEGVAAAGNPIGNNNIGTNSFQFEEHGEIAPAQRPAQTFYVDANFLPTLQIGLAQGRNFSATNPTDQYGSVLVNETLVKELGWEDPIGRRVRLKTGPDGHIGESVVIGVVKDFNIYSLQHKIEPLLLQMPPVPKEKDNLYVRVNRQHIPQALKTIGTIYHRYDPASAYEYHFLDENFSGQYAAEEKQGRLILVFTGLAIFIACLGLFGLVTFSVGQRTKEIGIRKVLGATVGGIVALVSWDLIKPVVLAILIATPVAWYIMQRWLEGFAYRVEITLWIFLAAGLLAALVALLTVGLRAMQAARSNPVKSLRTE